jgi:biopolymer transport protein ExbD
MQLLIFFLLTFAFANTQGMNVTLPKMAQGEPPQKTTVTVTIMGDKMLYVNNETVVKDQLAARLAALLAGKPDAQVVVRAHKDLLLQDVVEVFDIAKTSGATRLFIATDTK